jgi:predicted ArsR family transcriptional regulator
VLLSLLRLVAETGSADSAELARRLGVTPALMQGMLDTLAREGYLKRVVADTSAACAQCPLHRECLSGGKARLWSLSEKGTRALAREKGDSP